MKNPLRSKREYRCLVAMLCAWIVVTPVGALRSEVLINEINMGPQDYFEVINYSTSPVNLSGYTVELWDSALGGWNPTPVIAMPNTTLGPNQVLTFAENGNPANGEIDTPNMWMYHSRDLSIVIRDAAGMIADVWAHGTSYFGPAGVTINPAPVNSINQDTNAVTYQRVLADGTNGTFETQDWSAAPGTRNQFNDPIQVVAVPEPQTLVMSLISVLLGGIVFWRRHRDAPRKGAEEAGEASTNAAGFSVL